MFFLSIQQRRRRLSRQRFTHSVGSVTTDRGSGERGTAALVLLGLSVDGNEETVELFQGLLLPSLFRPVCLTGETWHLRIMKELHLLDEWHGMKECLPPRSPSLSHTPSAALRSPRMHWSRS